jgi:hypothetical protein
MEQPMLHLRGKSCIIAGRYRAGRLYIIKPRAAAN